MKSKNEKIEAEIMDLNSLDSIKDFTDRIRKNCDRIDILINNAGELFFVVKKLFNRINR